MYDILAIGLALITAVTWGFMPIMTKKFGGKPIQWVLGSAIGIFILGVISCFVFIVGYKCTINLTCFIVMLVSGMGWTLFIFCQLALVNKWGSTNAMPITFAIKLISINVFAMIALYSYDEWNLAKIFLVSSACIIMIFAALLINKKTNPVVKPINDQKKKFDPTTLIYFILCVVSIIGFASLPTVMNAYWDGKNSIHTPFNNEDMNKIAASLVRFVPQSIGILFAAILMTLFFAIKSKTFKAAMKETYAQKYSYLNIITGLVYGIGNITLLISYAYIASSIAFSVAQLLVPVSVIGGIFILHEKKTKQEYINLSIGTLLLIACCFEIGFIKYIIK